MQYPGYDSFPLARPIWQTSRGQKLQQYNLILCKPKATRKTRNRGRIDHLNVQFPGQVSFSTDHVFVSPLNVHA